MFCQRVCRSVNHVPEKVQRGTVLPGAEITDRSRTLNRGSEPRLGPLPYKSSNCIKTPSYLYYSSPCSCVGVGVGWGVAQPHMLSLRSAVYEIDYVSETGNGYITN